PDRPDIGPSMLELEPAGPGSWEAEATAIAQPARWRATAVITYAADGVEGPLEFEVPAAGEPARPSPAHDPRLVELRGFEPLTPSMRTRCATGLRHSPMGQPAERYHRRARDSES